MSLHSPLSLHINGAEVPSTTGETFTVFNPMTGQPLFECASAGVDDYAAAIGHAQKAFQSWSATPPSIRRNIFLRAADILTSYLETDAPEILANEVSAVKSMVRLNVLASAAMLRESAGLVTHIKGEIVPADRLGTTIMVMREAVGVVFAISPWNMPVNLTVRAIATPLICGNTVILKPSEYSPKSQHLVVRALKEAGLPAGCLNFLPSSPGNAPTVTEFAVKHRLVRRVNFTGSDRVGKIIAGWASTCVKQCLLELGGKAPALVLEDADLDDAVEAVLFGGLANSGQICMSTERVIVHSAIADAFVELLLRRVAQIKVGNHLEDPSVSLSGLYCAAAPKRILDLIASAEASGATLLHGDRQVSGPNGTILQPHILDRVAPSMAIFREETFGPVLCLTRAASTAEAIDIANDSEYTLCASVFTRDALAGMEIAAKVRAGSCHVNGPTVYIEPTLPNGGTGGRSGYGRFGGMAGVEEFTEKKIVSLVKPGMKYAF
ncbi:hypothetical protein ASPZODRAFT_63812 [Penicilliopsis zonata CBS 506.65]|uniref:Aldehyde dehydrogenase domain-containing protein n=1 Tax=Penicilliopsis zonata CBS 506.65 TaxID=1073090 RepID=A0A1L9SLA0_9EURO|nr:hypothetical protein ASPZODRAFT_63812 [Penicilliopsis zonata CBS 506.65]OJJ47857.1 hypothetical protein ASPZODRAFT_63812 [Penicilliopsis zonata CBS 506.65]